MYNRKLTRLSGFDYSGNRYYFVTICVKDHSSSFGKVENKSMQLSQNGIIAMEQWLWLGTRYPYIDLISFVIMPNHVHGIIYIDADFYNNDVGNGRDRSLQIRQPNQIDRPDPKIKPLPELIGAYKTTVSKRIHMSGDVEFKWQKSFHDHIIRNIKSLDNIKHYIETNPENWL